jgi:hypothetical protein
LSPDIARSVALTTVLAPSPSPITDRGAAALGEEIARFHWAGVSLSLDALPDGTILFAAGNETHRISDWLDPLRIAAWVVIASRILRLSIEVESGDEVVFRTPQLRAQQDALIAVSRRLGADASRLQLRIESPSTGVELAADLSVPQAQSLLASLGAAVGEASQIVRGVR